MFYFGILDGKGKVWGIRVPDLPGCHGGGSSPEAAMADAVSAVRDWIDHQRSRGNAAPPPRPLNKILADPNTSFDAKGGEVVVILPVTADKGRVVRANLSIDAGLLDAIDDEAKRRGLTRSAFLASAALDKITEQR